MSYGGRIAILPGQEPAGELSTLVHELAHEMLHKAERRTATTKTVHRYQMQQPCFHGLRRALLDAEVRVRIEEEIPFAVPHILGLHMEGSFFSGVSIRLSTDLNWIIGGRGAGKSTTLKLSDFCPQMEARLTLEMSAVLFPA